MLDRPLLTQEQRDKLDAQQLDWERHNMWRILSQDGTNGWKCPCLCSKCQSGETPQPDIREA